MTNRFGTSEEMVIQTVEENGIVYSLAIDGKGLYLTQSGRISAQMADPNRYTSNRADVAARLSALGLDPVELAADNQNRISVATSDAKKVNPLKAAKRAIKKAS